MEILTIKTTDRRPSELKFSGFDEDGDMEVSVKHIITNTMYLTADEVKEVISYLHDQLNKIEP
jgi:hypothetical protein